MPSSERLQIVGIRHHSPSCARLVREAIDRFRPRRVLIEGPADFNPRIGELLLEHRPPLAIFTFCQEPDQPARSVWSPFCEWSPEWQALRHGAASGAEVLFCDLPAWHEVFRGRRNLTSDLETAPADTYLAALCRRAGVDDHDALWDHLFEQPAPPEQLERALERHFVQLRGEESAGPRDGPREDYMAEVAAWALAGDPAENVLLVCGGWHAPAIRRALAARKAPPPRDFPPVPTAYGAEVVRGSYLVPYTYERLDAFKGYDAGMPSPFFYEAVWREGPENAAESLLEGLAGALRGRLPLSTADLLAGLTAARGLARLRGHAALSRSDLLDGLSSALIKEALVVPAPWDEHRGLHPQTDPVHGLLLTALRGAGRGRLAAGTPQPALVPAVFAELEAEDLLDLRREKVELRLLEPAGRRKSRLLHRLRLLGIPGFASSGGPARRTSGDEDWLVERWLVERSPDLEAALIEAAAWGATLESAAVACLEAALLEAAGRTLPLARLLREAVFVGLGQIAESTLAQAGAAIGAEPSLQDLGLAAGELLALFRHGELLGAAGAPALAGVLAACGDRGLFLLEGCHGEELPADPAEIAALVALRDLHRTRGIDLQLPRALGVFARVAADREAPPALRGGALGALWSLGGLGDATAAAGHAAAALRAAARPQTCGDFLAGLFATARAEVVADGGLLAVLDAVIAGFGDEELLIALPSLRLAFGYFPPLEKDELAGRLLALHGGDPLDRRRLLRLPADALQLAAGLALERRVLAAARKYGLDDPLDAADLREPAAGEAKA